MKRSSPPVSFAVGSFVDVQIAEGNVRRGVRVRSLPFVLPDDTWVLHLEGIRPPVDIRKVKAAQLVTDDTPEML